MKRIKRNLAAGMAVLMLMTSVSVPAEAAVRLNKTKATVQVGKTVKLKVKGAKKVKWKSSNKKIATVSGKGVVRGKKKGVVTIRATVGKKSYKCKVTVKKAKQPASSDTADKGTASTPPDVVSAPPSATANTEPCPNGNHVMVRTDEYEVEAYGEEGNYHKVYWIEQCEDCGYRARQSEFESGSEECTFGEKKVIRPAACEEDGYQNQVCIYCGQYKKPWRDEAVIPHTGHDFRYEYHKDITVSEDWDRLGEYSKAMNRSVQILGERTAICNTCGKQYEEVGIDTGLCLEDGTHEIVWGVWRKDKSDEMHERINEYRSAYKGTKREPLEQSDSLNRLALQIVAESVQRLHYDLPGDSLKGEWGIGYMRGEGGDVDAEYDLGTFPFDLVLQLQKDMKYTGTAYFEYDLGNGTFMSAVMVLGDREDEHTWNCSHADGWEPDEENEQHLRCHRCGESMECWQHTFDEYGGGPDEETGIATCERCGYAVQYAWVVDAQSPYGEWRNPAVAYVCHHTDDKDSTLKPRGVEPDGLEARCSVCQNYFEWVGDDSDEGGHWEQL